MRDKIVPPPEQRVHGSLFHARTHTSYIHSSCLHTVPPVFAEPTLERQEAQDRRVLGYAHEHIVDGGAPAYACLAQPRETPSCPMLCSTLFRIHALELLLGPLASSSSRLPFFLLPLPCPLVSILSCRTSILGRAPFQTPPSLVNHCHAVSHLDICLRRGIPPLPSATRCRQPAELDRALPVPVPV